MRCPSVVTAAAAISLSIGYTIAAVAPPNESAIMITKQPNDETRPEVTIGFLVLLYSVFLFEWHYRLCRKEVQSCYQTLVVEKKLYLLLVSLVSHAAATSTSTPTSSPATERNGTLVRTLYESICRGGSLSGLPLLAWSSYLLWKMQTLEESSGSSIAYFRLWISLMTVSISLEMLFLRYLCVKSTGSMVISSSSTLLGSLLAIFCFVGSGKDENHFISVAIDFLILTLLALPFHTCGSFFGFVSGLLHVSEITTFLAQPYWNNYLILSVFGGCCFSLKAHLMVRSDTSNGDYLPCIDYVSSSWWNSSTTRQQQQQRRNGDSNVNNYDERINSISSFEGQVIIDVEPGLTVENNGNISTVQQPDEDRNVSSQFQQLHGPRSRQRPINT